jgi:uncharacterized Rmd1/YagE family protein
MTIALPFEGQTEVRVRALYLGERIDQRALENTSKLGVAPLTVIAGARGIAVLFRYGAVVLYNVTPIEEAALLADIAPMMQQRFAEPESEEALVRVDEDKAERGANGVISLHCFDVERLQVVADALAKSVVLAHYEATIGQAFDRVEPLAEDLTRTGSTRRSRKELLRQIGSTLLIQTKTVWRVEVSDKPEILWERPDLELLYTRLLDEYELEERHKALDRKLDLIARTANTTLELLHNQRSLRVEWYIVLLIVIEIVISLYELAVH